MYCETGKVRYHSAEKAKNDLDRVRQRGQRNKNRKMPTRYYQCNLCKGWHLASAPFIRR